MPIGPQISPSAAQLSANLRALRAQISAAAAQAQRSVDSITLVAVSKGHDAGSIRALHGLGVHHFGESYLQEALPKLALLRDLGLTWHFIGRVQANKTRAIAEHFAWVHAVDRLRIAERLAAQRPAHLGALNVCLQINPDGQGARGGAGAAQALELSRSIAALPRLRLRGLMVMAGAGGDAQANRGCFAQLRSLQQQLIAAGVPLDSLSMGMSGDYREAILEGATIVRIGTALFGPRLRAGLR